MRREVVDRLGAHLAVERHVGDLDAIAEERPQRARVHDRAGKQVRPDLLALLEHRDRHLAQPFGERRLLGEQLADADRARETGRPRSDDEHADLDALVRRIARLGDDFAPGKRRRILRGLNAHDLRCFTSSVSCGTISCRSPTTPRSANSKIGALPSLLIATIVPELCMPTLCWIAPEMPTAT